MLSKIGFSCPHFHYKTSKKLKAQENYFFIFKDGHFPVFVKSFLGYANFWYSPLWIMSFYNHGKDVSDHWETEPVQRILVALSSYRMKCPNMFRSYPLCFNSLPKGGNLKFLAGSRSWNRQSECQHQLGSCGGRLSNHLAIEKRCLCPFPRM